MALTEPPPTHRAGANDRSSRRSASASSTVTDVASTLVGTADGVTTIVVLALIAANKLDPAEATLILMASRRAAKRLDPRSGDRSLRPPSPSTRRRRSRRKGQRARDGETAS